MFVKRAGNSLLTKTLEEWRKYNDDRENHWIREIQTYFEDVTISNSILLAGSAHRIGLMDKVRNLSGTRVNWDFYPFK